MNAAPTIAELLRRGAATLSDRSDSPRLDAELLLGSVLDLDRPALFVRADRPVESGAADRYGALLARRLEGVPVAYLTGTREFWSLPLAVSPAVLVPRPETEILVEAALERLPGGAEATVLDLGTGSGAIAIAIASERPHALVTATDVSPEALEVARRNALALHGGRIEWRRGSWYEAVPGARFDLIVSNPPYVAESDPALRQLAAEPIEALTPGRTGLEALEEIIGGASRHLRDGGSLIVEHGATQAPAVRELFRAGGFDDIEQRRDRAELPRIAAGRIVGKITRG